MTDDELLTRVLSEIQRRGAIGRGPITEAIAHARRFVAALPGADAGVTHLVDLGSGGGLPALVIAADRPDLHVTLVERREKRADLLRYGVQALGVRERADVVAADVEALIASGRTPPADVVTARSFAPPIVVLDVASRLLRAGGCCLISDPPDGRGRWTTADLARLGFTDDAAHGGIHRFGRS